MTEAFADSADLLDLVQESIFVRDLEGRILYWNKASEALYGFHRAAALGQDVATLLHTRYGVPLESITAQLHDTGRWEGEITRRTVSGDERQVFARWSLRPSSTGGPATIVESGHDITGRKQAEQALGNSEYRYRNLFQAMAASFWELDFSAVGQMTRKLREAGITDLRRHFSENPDIVREMIRQTRVVDVNDQSLALFGGGDKAALLQSIEPFWPDASSMVYAESVVAALSRKPNYAAETRLRRLDGHEFDVLFTACFPPESLARGTLLVGVIDISARVRAQAALQKLQADFAHAARVSMLGELTASLAHEVNQPLAAIATNGEASLRWLGRPEPNLDEVNLLARRMVADARRAADIISRIRSMASRQVQEKSALPVKAVIEEALLFLRHEMQGQGVMVSLDLASDLPPTLGDRTQLQQVVVNLLLNAMQAMAQTGAARRMIAVTSRLSAPDTMQVTVEDSGPGIADAHRAQLFDSFFTTKDAGMGMGLAICRSIIEGHGGQIWVDAAAADGGARFSFTLPVVSQG
ncbi:ATP-binding protein [Ferrovibrio terrae]|uniref:PAS domain-containing sensor histidine kinase n=1 Tax=Ferrovibrio terrae TaxID=2594003 RepID=UPI003137B0EC